MAQKWNLQDIVPPDRKGTRRAPSASRPPAMPPTTFKGTPPSAAPHVPDEETLDLPDTTSPIVARLEIQDGRLSRARKFIVFGIAIAVILFIGFSITILLSGAEVTVYPKEQSTTVQATFEASLTPKAGQLGYELLSLEESGERRVTASGQEEVKERAGGTITVYNSYSTTAQRLIKNTRFESKEGLIYRIIESIVIPGYTKNAQGEVIPGKVDTTVFAEGVGETYNIDKALLTIPGLKGSDQYDKMHAEVAEGGLTGGFEGTKFIIDETELSTARQELQMELRNKLLERVKGETPHGFILYDAAITFAYDSLPATEAGEKTAVLKEVARLHVPLFEQGAFAARIASQAVPGFERADVLIEDPSTLTFMYAGEELIPEVWNKSAITFKLSGAATIVWQFSEEKLKEDLAGISKKGLLTVLSGYPAISKAEAVIRPFWKRNFPEDVKEITVKIGTTE